MATSRPSAHVLSRSVVEVLANSFSAARYNATHVRLGSCRTNTLCVCPPADRRSQSLCIVCTIIYGAQNLPQRVQICRWSAGVPFPRIGRSFHAVRCSIAGKTTTMCVTPSSRRSRPPPLRTVRLPTVSPPTGHRSRTGCSAVRSSGIQPQRAKEDRQMDQTAKEK